MVRVIFEDRKQQMEKSGVCCFHCMIWHSIGVLSCIALSWDWLLALGNWYCIALGFGNKQGLSAYD